MYLRASLEQVETKVGTKFLLMNAKKYVKAEVINLEPMPTKRDMQLSTSHSPIPKNYNPSEDVSNELNTQGVQAYQELIGELLWEVEIGIVDIFLEVALLSSPLALSISVHLQAVYKIFGHLNQFPKRKLYFNPVSLFISKYQFHKFE